MCIRVRSIIYFLFVTFSFKNSIGVAFKETYNDRVEIRPVALDLIEIHHFLLV